MHDPWTQTVVWGLPAAAGGAGWKGQRGKIEEKVQGLKSILNRHNINRGY